MKKIHHPSQLQTMIADYQLEQVFPKDCLSQLELVLYQAGDYICRQGTEQVVIPYFLKGRLKIVHSLENGSDTILEIQEKPGLLGEIELLLDRVCITSVIADQDSLVVQLSARHFKDRLLLDPTFLRSTAKTLAKKLHQINYFAPANFHYSVKKRVATHFLEHCDEKGTIKPKMNQLALLFGISYRHLSRVIKQMIDEGLIKRDGRVYTILDRKRMGDLSIKHTETTDRKL